MCVCAVYLYMHGNPPPPPYSPRNIWSFAYRYTLWRSHTPALPHIYYEIFTTARTEAQVYQRLLQPTKLNLTISISIKVIPSLSVFTHKLFINFIAMLLLCSARFSPHNVGPSSFLLLPSVGSVFSNRVLLLLLRWHHMPSFCVALLYMYGGFCIIMDKGSGAILYFVTQLAAHTLQNGI